MAITTTPSGGPQGEFSTYTPIYAQTLSANTSSITFSNIPTTYTDLELVISAQNGTAANYTIYARFNGDSSTLYSTTYLGGSGTAAFSGRDTTQTSTRVGFTNASNLQPQIVKIMNYSNTTTYKTLLSRANESGTGVYGMVGLCRSTAPITSITLYNESSANFASGSTFTIYGIKAAATAPKATGGDVITTDGTYWYHAFKNTGAFSLTSAVSSLTADILVVAGGGGADANIAGGGGAGGLRVLTGQTVSGSTTVTVGGGGSGGVGASGYGTSGINSSFGSISATGGGRGAYGGYSVGFSGGSGGGIRGGSAGNGGAGNAGGYTPAEGNSGSYAVDSTSGGGGGGAGGAGAAGSSSAGGNGGAGANSYNSITVTSWLSATGTGASGYLAGGGGGNGGFGRTPGSGGSGGGGAGGADNSNGTSGTTNTGSGGGGGGYASPTPGSGGSGGSGIVIVRYLG